MIRNRYVFDVIDANGSCKRVAEMVKGDMAAIFDKVIEISDGIAEPGYRIRVNDQDGNAVFVGLTTSRQGSGRRGNFAA